jgi:hypothetical protein
MRIDGSTRALTELDEETQSILLRRLHPRINNFNDVVLFLMQCNMDIKYIGSGEAAKALVYYVTDYITKNTVLFRSIRHTSVTVTYLIISAHQHKVAMTCDKWKIFDKICIFCP